MARKSQRDAILDATEKVVGNQGLIHTTLETVAAEAGISKGGLLYHFSSKKDLLRSLIERHAARFASRKEEVRGTLPDTPGRELKAYLMARLSDPSRENMSVSKMVGVLEDDDLRECVTNIKKQEFQAIEKNREHPEKSAILVLALEGLWMYDLFNIPAFTPELRQKVIAEILGMVDKACQCAG